MNNKNELAEGLDVLNRTKMQYFGKEMTAEFYALKGMMYHLSSKWLNLKAGSVILIIVQ